MTFVTAHYNDLSIKRDIKKSIAVGNAFCYVFKPYERDALLKV